MLIENVLKVQSGITLTKSQYLSQFNAVYCFDPPFHRSGSFIDLL